MSKDSESEEMASHPIFAVWLHASCGSLFPNCEKKLLH